MMEELIGTRACTLPPGCKPSSGSGPTFRLEEPWVRNGRASSEHRIDRNEYENENNQGYYKRFHPH